MNGGDGPGVGIDLLERDSEAGTPDMGRARNHGQQFKVQTIGYPGIEGVGGNREQKDVKKQNENHGFNHHKAKPGAKKPGMKKSLKGHGFALPKPSAGKLTFRQLTSPPGRFCMLKLLFLCLWMNASSANAAGTGVPVHAVVFDLDRTLFNPNPRIAKILDDIGAQLDLPTLRGLKPEAVSRLVGGDRSVLGTSDPALLQKIFGNHRDGSHRTSEFGKRFYFDSSYLVHDEMIPGASEFVRRVQQESGARIVYLSGRIREHFEEATWKQLEDHGFPGREDATLILKPMGEGATPAETRGTYLTNDEFKIRALRDWMAEQASERSPSGRQEPGRVIAVFDDSSRNLARFAAELDPGTVLVRVTPSLLSVPAEGRIQRISGYLDQLVLLEQLVAASTDCRSFLLPEK